MSEARRAYDLLRAFVGRESDRVKETWAEFEKMLAETPSPGSKPSPSAPTASPAEPDPRLTAATPEDTRRVARRILGVEEGASFPEIRRAYEKISRRAKSENFPAGSDAAGQAQELLRRASWAYQALTKDMDATQKRFQSLEIDAD